MGALYKSKSVEVSGSTESAKADVKTMDERTRRTDEELAPGARRLIPDPFKPSVKAPPLDTCPE